MVAGNWLRKDSGILRGEVESGLSNGRSRLLGFVSDGLASVAVSEALSERDRKTKTTRQHAIASNANGESTQAMKPTTTITPGCRFLPRKRPVRRGDGPARPVQPKQRWMDVHRAIAG